MAGKVVLASASPRRKFLLESAGFDVVVRAPNADETWPGGPVDQAVIILAQRKLAKVAPGAESTPYIAADTVVAESLEQDASEPLGKPRDAAEAAAMLRRLAGRTHAVVTGFVVARGGRQHVEAVRTQVRFRALSDAEIARYVATGEPFDKAGAYGIQGAGGALVQWIEGSYTNVVGLPLAEVLAALDRLQ